MNENKVLENVELLNRLIEMLPDGRREKMKAMFDGPVGTAFCIAPASSKAHYHECYPGGLLQHSLNVVKNLTKMTNALCPGKYPKEQVVFVALCHDLGKAGDGEQEHYVQTTERWKKDRGELYQMNTAFVPWMTVNDRTVWLLQKYGVEVTADELLALKLADGQYEKSNEPYKSREPELALLLHWSDHFAMRQEKLEFSSRSE